MNWVKKLANFFLGEEDRQSHKTSINSSEETGQTEQSVLNESPKRKEFYEGKHHGEARVSYQYPKGNFKFPVIPDEAGSKGEKRPSSRRAARHAEPEELDVPLHLHTKPNTFKAKPYNEQEEYPSHSEVRKKPFHLTAIPSPIHGFQSKPIVEKNSVKPNGDEPDDIPLFHLYEKEEGVTPKGVQTSRKNTASALVETSNDTQNHQEELITNQLFREDLSELNGSEEDNSPVSFVEEFGQDVHQEEEFRIETAEEEEELVEEAISIIQSKEDSREEGQEDTEQLVEVEILHERDAIHVDSPHQHGNVKVEGTEAVEDQKKTSVSMQRVEQQGQRQEEKSPKGRTLPFNVMMLGRDKQKMQAKKQDVGLGYQFPTLSYLNIPSQERTEDDAWLQSQSELLDVTLKNFNVRASVVNVTQGPSVTRFEVHPEPGVKVNKITNLSDDIKLSLAAKDIRIEAPIPGKNTIGIEVPNKESKMVYLREILRSSEFRSNPSPMNAVLGLDISGQPAVTDLKKMPHGLIAGATGSGKSVCINTILISLLYKATPQEVKLMLIDPKMVELAPYNDIPHLVSPVITDVKAATAALKWAVEEMERRYELFAHSGTREITRYNQLVKEHKQGEHLPYLVIIIDELADLMMVAPNDVEEAICRIAQKARACGIHLIVATQRPSVDVITGLIKANIPTRIAFSVSSQVDSRTIIDVVGAEKLLGKGDMLFLENGSSKAVRLQGTFVSDEEIERVVKHVKQQGKPDFLFHQEELVRKASIQSDEDELFVEACEFVVNQGGASTSSLQRRFRIGYNRAARLMDMMEEQGIISENRGSKPRDILISEEDLELLHDGSTLT
ncbi:DNA translocase FtsK [Bacillus weihaiensis]|uniref:FtsK domain-containing protein n=1 Tax=Bacillus weihaiensis TaxID=1547283 RepID=A0A1L3MNY2_9BACI|nr:DNA translocase FtsK [Bacillus weihaiensis]APH04049.1 hypothetical protein A9C19_04465 [Bacillus weihaiensis]